MTVEVDVLDRIETEHLGTILKQLEWNAEHIIIDKFIVLDLLVMPCTFFQNELHV